MPRCTTQVWVGDPWLDPGLGSYEGLYDPGFGSWFEWHGSGAMTRAWNNLWSYVASTLLARQCGHCATSIEEGLGGTGEVTGHSEEAPRGSTVRNETAKDESHEP